MENMNPFTRLTVFFKNIVDNNIKMIKKIFAMIQQEHLFCQLITGLTQSQFLSQLLCCGSAGSSSPLVYPWTPCLMSPGLLSPLL